MRIRVNYANGSHVVFDNVLSTSFYTFPENGFSGLIIYRQDESPMYIEHTLIESVWSYAR